jgi:hypothetical protein
MKRKNCSEKKRKNGLLFSLERAKTKRNGSRFASFRFQAKKNFMRNRRTLSYTIFFIIFFLHYSDYIHIALNIP